MPVEIIQPRRRLLDIWAAAASQTMQNGKWVWGDANGSNSVIDAQQLLCFLLPATQMAALRLEDTANIAPDASAALAPFGGNAQTVRVLVAALEEFVEHYTRADGSCDFSGGSSFIALDPDLDAPLEGAYDIVASYTASISLCLSALGFLEEYLDFLPQRSTLRPRVTKLRSDLSLRLTSALVGLLRGFTLSSMTHNSPEGRRLVRLLNQDHKPLRQVLTAFAERMKSVRGRLGEARLGVEKASELDDPNLLFEIGWTWGIASDAPAVELRSSAEEIGRQATGVALSLPFLYFTMQATESIELLFSERTRVLGILNEEQERLAAALSIRRDLTQMYYSRLARFGDSWPLEDLPWRTLGGGESDYYSLLVCAVLIQDLRQRNANEEDLRRLEPLMSDMANRARITRRPLHDDPMTALHSPGLMIELETSEPLPRPMGWQVNDFAPVLFKRTAQLAQLTSDPAIRDRLLLLTTKIWNHLQNRQITSESGHGMWDNPYRTFYALAQSDGVLSWTMTSQIVDALVTTADVLGRSSARSPELMHIASAMVSEAEFLLNQQLLSTPALATVPYQASLQQIRESMQRASGLIASQPALALALSVNAINQLDDISLGRLDVKQGS